MQHAVKFYKTNLSLFKKLKEASFNNTKQWVLGTFISNNIWQILTAPWSVLLFKCTRIQNDIQQLITSYTIIGRTRLIHRMDVQPTKVPTLCIGFLNKDKTGNQCMRLRSVPIGGSCLNV